MKKILPYIILFFLLITANVYSQKTDKKDNYTFLVQKEQGDLNNDKYNDKVVLEMDVDHDSRKVLESSK